MVTRQLKEVVTRGGAAYIVRSTSVLRQVFSYGLWILQDRFIDGVGDLQCVLTRCCYSRVVRELLCCIFTLGDLRLAQRLLYHFIYHLFTYNWGCNAYRFVIFHLTRGINNRRFKVYTFINGCRSFTQPYGRVGVRNTMRGLFNNDRRGITKTSCFVSLKSQLHAMNGDHGDLDATRWGCSIGANCFYNNRCVKIYHAILLEQYCRCGFLGTNCFYQGSVRRRT